MDPIQFPEVTNQVAKDQPEYRTLPAYCQPNDPQGKMTFCWQLEPDEIATIIRDGVIWHTVLTFNQPLQPMLLSVVKPKMPQ